MSETANIIVKIVLAILFAIITKYLIPYLKTLKDDARWTRLIDMVQTAVEAAEQSIHEKGAIKKEAVTKFVTDWLNSQSIKVTSEEIDKLIEAAVYKMNNPNSKINVSTYLNGELVDGEEIDTVSGDVTVE